MEQACRPEPVTMITLRIRSQLQAVEWLSLAIRGLCTHVTLTQLNAARIELAVVEAVNNAIIHACEGQAGHWITVTWEIYPQQLRIGISECGRTMNQLPSGELPDWRAERGRGWAIIKACVDHIEYRTDQGQNTLTLIKNLQTTAL